jgi:hypothetical protein
MHPAVEEEAQRGRLELGGTIQAWLRWSRPTEGCGLLRNPDPALDANYSLNMVADDRATRSQVVRPSREFQSHGPTTQRKPHLVLLRTVMFGYDLLRNT